MQAEFKESKVKLEIIRAVQKLGVHVQRWHDPYKDLKRLAHNHIIGNILDGGCYKGTAANQFLKLFPSSTVHCVEPQPDQYSALENKFEDNDRVRLHQLALSDSEGEVSFNINEERYTSSIQASNTADIRTESTVRVHCSTIDALLDKEGIAGGFDVMKLDLQGHELAALQGAAHSLKHTRFILCEINFRERYKNCAMIHDLLDYLASHGFVVYRFYQLHGYPDGGLKLGDAIFYRSSIR